MYKTIGQLTLTASVDNSALLDFKADVTISVPTFVSEECALTETEQAMTEQFAEGLNAAGFSCYAEPYLCAKRCCT